jgi:hypothetical protein
MLLFLFVPPALLLSLLPLPRLGLRAIRFALPRLVGIERPNNLIDRPLAGHEAVDPVQIGEPDPQAAPGLCIVDAERDDDLMAIARDRDLSADVFMLVAAIRKDQQYPRLASIASVISSSNGLPGRTSRGAIQQGTSRRSNSSTISSATDRSSLTWLTRKRAGSVIVQDRC